MKINRDILKIIAVVVMTIDHIGYLLVPESVILRAIGRVAFPIFAYFVAEGFRYTSNKEKYLIRMLVAACVTQLLFTIVQLDFVNVMFTFAISIGILISFERIPNYNWSVLFLGLLISVLIDCDYSFYGVLMVMLFYYEKSFVRISIGIFILTTLLLLFQINFNIMILFIIFNDLEMYISFFLQYLCMFSIPLLMMYDHKRIVYNSSFLKQGMKYLFYCYYPLHLIVLKLIGG